MPVIKSDTLTNFAADVLEAAGVTGENARLVSASLVKSNLMGHDSHGVVRVSQYLDTIAAGNLNPTAQPRMAHDTAVTAMVDARHGFGQIAAHFAMKVTIKKAQASGLAATGLVNSNHVGRLGEWVQMAADEGLIGLAFCNGGRPGGLVAPYGGAGRFLGTNPVAAAVPVAGRSPIVIDFATSIAPEGKVRVARNKRQPVPPGWILDANGQPTTNPNDLYAGGMLLPMAQHKGFGLSLLVELMGGILTGQGCSGLPNYTVLRNGVLFVVLSIEAFRPPEDVLAEGADFCSHLKAVPPAPGFDEVLLPGEPEQRIARQRRSEGIPIDDITWSQLAKAASALGVTIPEV